MKPDADEEYERTRNGLCSLVVCALSTLLVCMAIYLAIGG